MKIPSPASAAGLYAFAIAGALCATSLHAAETGSAQGVGEAVAVIDNANITGEIGDRTLAVGARVFMGDLIKTDGAGEAQLLFADETRMVVGPNSSLIIDEFVFRNEASVSKFAVRALGGAFRFMTGKSEKESYSIRTPSATIGVRGTAFDFSVAPDGRTDLVLFHGSAHVCGNGGSCETVVHTCDLARSDLNEAVEVIRQERKRARVTSSLFPYVASQSSLRSDFKLATESCGEVAVIDVDPVDPTPVVRVEKVETVVTVASAPPPPANDPPPPPPAAPPPPVGDGNDGLGNGDGENPGCKGGGCVDVSNPGRGHGDDTSPGQSGEKGNGGGNSTSGGGGGANSASGGNGNDTSSAGADTTSNGNGRGGGNGRGNGNGRGGRG